MSVNGQHSGGGGRRRVLVPQALGADEFLRVTWHPQRRVMVFSHWQGERCVAATPVRVDDIAELAELTVSALASSVREAAATWPSPHPADCVKPDFLWCQTPREGAATG